MRRLANVQRSNSLSNRLRSRRFVELEASIDRRAGRTGRPTRILDVGGTNSFWEQRGLAGDERVEVLIVNPQLETSRHSNIDCRIGDATNLEEFEDQSFDLVFSNSVIEHLGSAGAQKAMAREVRRVGRGHWVQTPSFWFPIEPHFLFFGWQWLPRDLRVWALRRRRFGWRGPYPERARAAELVDEIRLMRRKEVAALFPDSEIRAERIGPFVKSFIAVRTQP